MLNIVDEETLELELSAPTDGVLETLRRLDGDILVLGAGGKMGPSLARMARRACDQIGQQDRRIIAASRFSSAAARFNLERWGIETIACDLLNREHVLELPDCPNIIYMAGQKFGTSNHPELTWAMNAVVPIFVAERFASSRIVVFSTGCVYPLVSRDGPGANESTPLGPPGDYSNSCVGRERIFSFYSQRNSTPMIMFRLCYAIEMRYGVLADIGNKVWADQPIDVSMGAANVIWQGDASARAIQCLQHTSTPPTLLNVTSIRPFSIRFLAEQFGRVMNKKLSFVGKENDLAWIWDASESYRLFGPPRVSIDEMIDATANWIQRGGSNLGKPTHFEVTDGNF